MKRTLCALLLLLLCCFAALPALAADAPATGSYWALYDDADLFTDEEEQQLAETMQQLLAATPIRTTLVVATAYSADGRSAMEQADDIFDEIYLGKHTPLDGSCFLIDMYNREMWISCSGVYSGILDYDRIQLTLDDCYDAVSAGQYAAGAAAFLENTARYLRPASGPLQLTVDGTAIDLYPVRHSEVTGWSAADDAAVQQKSGSRYVLLFDCDEALYYTLPGDGTLTPAGDDPEKVLFPVTPEMRREARILGAVGGGCLGGLVSLILLIVAKASRHRAQAAQLEGDYGVSAAVQLAVNEDRLLGERVERIYNPPVQRSSGGGGGGSTRSSFHSSSSGVRHSGGGRKF